MNILHIYKDYPPVLGGIENHVKWLAEGQASHGHDVTVLVTNPASNKRWSPAGWPTNISQENGVKVIRAGRLATAASTPLSVALPWQLLHQHPDVVHLHYPYPVGEVSQWLLKRGQVTVLTYHADIVRQTSILRFYRPILRRILRQVNAIIIGSPPMRGGIFLAEHQAKLYLIPYGIPLARFQSTPPHADRTRLNASLSSLPSSVPLVLFVGRLRYYKGLDWLIRALPQIAARLVVAGTGPMEAEWRALARQCGVTEQITWLGEVSDADLPALYHLAHLFVLPASHASEAFGLVQVEAMAAGLPVICTELGTGTSYVNQHGVTGLVIPPRNPNALAEAINSLLADQDRRVAMAAAARARAAEFDQRIMVARTGELYTKLLNMRNRACL